ncbi:hypothetical protein GP486_005834 [Trichoglossum hirsutum]|uniref:Uncharacterized protein n=1 Tax=Trichoglossum hirsutum TaxID=265104 RepID=A0A9P8RLZ1_9PEZI|nr:hypothetical protein GP486_005834 [Trichoglossum hirsutum]
MAKFLRAFIAADDRIPGITIVTDGNRIQRKFQKKYSGSSKTPDLAVWFVREDEDDPCRDDNKLGFVAEVGFSENYPSLVEDAKLWLEGKPEISIAMIVALEETPRYKCPVKGEGSDSLPQGPDILFEVKGEFGPVVLNGMVWAGEITDAFTEVWIRDPVTGLAIRNGDRINLLPPAELPQLEFKMSDFIDVSPDEDIVISFNWSRFRRGIRGNVKELAQDRYDRLMEKLLEDAEDGDGEYKEGENSPREPVSARNTPAREGTSTQGDVPELRRSARLKDKKAPSYRE